MSGTHKKRDPVETARLETAYARYEQLMQDETFATDLLVPVVKPHVTDDGVHYVVAANPPYIEPNAYERAWMKHYRAIDRVVVEQGITQMRLAQYIGQRDLARRRAGLPATRPPGRATGGHFIRFLLPDGTISPGPQWDEAVPDRELHRSERRYGRHIPDEVREEIMRVSATQYPFEWIQDGRQVTSWLFPSYSQVAERYGISYHTAERLRPLGFKRYGMLRSSIPWDAASSTNNN